MSGYSAADIQTFNFPTPKGVHPNDVDHYLACLEQVRHATDGTLVEFTYRLQHKEGHWIWINARETAFQRDADGKVDQVFGVARDITVQKRAEDEIQEMATAQERQRLARELHDSVTQTLFSATMVTQTLPLIWNKGEAIVKKNLDELSRLTFGALAEMRTLLNELRPNAIATADLGELLNQLVDAARGRSQAEFSLSIEGNEPFSPEVHLAIYRIAQEALNNCTKHARARHVNVQLSRHDGEALLRITDDGRGFNEDVTSATHFGLEIMRERAAEVGGAITVHSQSGTGTEVVFSWSPSKTLLDDKAIEAQA
jgi:PAS domain S-box-containing protein